MNKTINLHKMKTSLDPANNARYELEDICLNDYIGQQLKLEFLDEINCVACGAKTKKATHKGIVLCVCEDCLSVIYVSLSQSYVTLPQGHVEIQAGAKKIV